MLADGSALDCVKTPEKKLKQNDFWVDLKPGSNGSDIQLDSDKLRCEFEGFLLRFGKEICGRDYFRPLPPMLGDGHCVDLLKLLFAVRENGGYNVVSEEGLWYKFWVLLVDCVKVSEFDHGFVYVFACLDTKKMK